MHKDEAFWIEKMISGLNVMIETMIIMMLWHSAFRFLINNIELYKHRKEKKWQIKPRHCFHLCFLFICRSIHIYLVPRLYLAGKQRSIYILRSPEVVQGKKNKGWERGGAVRWACGDRVDSCHPSFCKPIIQKRKEKKEPSV